MKTETIKSLQKRAERAERVCATASRQMVKTKAFLDTIWNEIMEDGGDPLDLEKRIYEQSRQLAIVISLTP